MLNDYSNYECTDKTMATDVKTNRDAETNTSNVQLKTSRISVDKTSKVRQITAIG